MGQRDPNFSSGAFGKEGGRDTEEGLGQFIFQVRSATDTVGQKLQGYLNCTDFGFVDSELKVSLFLHSEGKYCFYAEEMSFCSFTCENLL